MGRMTRRRDGFVLLDALLAVMVAAIGFSGIVGAVIAIVGALSDTRESFFLSLQVRNDTQTAVYGKVRVDAE